ncbi:unnamed protein product [Orchesella dallaii]|uniref:RlpA-like protein double-psi beta-barrel domain-containing protein n=1 Tax=Orchesella dallaii TaxID=48710 RepID=A0ABP1RIH0_9HEXA
MKGSIYLLLVLGLAVSSTWANCWWTGCQPNTWAVRGCSQYSMTERESRGCRDGNGVQGNEYHCCPGGPGGPNPSPGGESGICSWYGAEGEIPPGHMGPCDTIFDPFAMEVAHKTLPCGTRLRVRNRDNGRTVDVTVRDRGPFVAGRILDLTYAAFGQVENRDRGTFSCDYQII